MWAASHLYSYRSVRKITELLQGFVFGDILLRNMIFEKFNKIFMETYFLVTGPK